MSNNSIALKRMFNENPHCHWCGKETFRNAAGGKQHHDTATVDHVYSKNMMHIRLFHNPKVLACYECNQFRNDTEQRLHIKSTNILNRLLIPIKLKWMQKKCYIAVN